MSEHPTTSASDRPLSQKIPPRVPFRQQLREQSEYTSATGRWLARGEPLEDHKGATVGTHPWRKVIWLTGVVGWLLLRRAIRPAQRHDRRLRATR